LYPCSFPWLINCQVKMMLRSELKRQAEHKKCKTLMLQLCQ
jgi:hypothetical protein